MGGMKSGTGDDLWGEETDESEEAQESSQPSEQPEQHPARETNPDTTTTETGSSSQQPYIIRRAVQNKSVQFERDERLTFFVHDDVAEGERELVTEAEAAFGRNIPVFDVREAVYRAALQNREDVHHELERMGYEQTE